MNREVRGHNPSVRRVGAVAVGGAGALLALASAGLSGATPARADTTTTQSFTTAGGHLFTVPAGVTTIHVLAVGAAGGAGNAIFSEAPKSGAPPSQSSMGGDGAQVVADVTVTPGENLCAFVNVGGGQGVTDDSNNTSGAGGGETDLRTTPDTSPTCANSTPAMRLLAAAGGGGGPIPAFISPLPPAPNNGLTIQLFSEGGHAGWGTATPGNPVDMPQPCAPGTGGTAGGGATNAEQGGGGGCTTFGTAGTGPSGQATGGSVAGGGDGENGGGQGGGGGGGAGLTGGGGGASDQSSGGAGGGGASCAPCAAITDSTSTTTSTLDAWRQAGPVHTAAVLKGVAKVAPAGGAAPIFTVSSTVVAVIPPTPPSGAAGPVAWQPVLLVTGIVLIGFAGVLRRRDVRGR